MSKVGGLRSEGDAPTAVERPSSESPALPYANNAVELAGHEETVEHRETLEAGVGDERSRVDGPASVVLHHQREEGGGPQFAIGEVVEGDLRTRAVDVAVQVRERRESTWLQAEGVDEVPQDDAVPERRG